MTRLFAGTPFDIPPECEDCGKLESECVCTPEDKQAKEDAARRQADRLEPGQQTATLRTEKRKAGRKVTVVEGLAARANDLPELLAQLQSECGAGGTVKFDPDRIELQGDHVTKVRAVLARIGFRVR